MSNSEVPGRLTPEARREQIIDVATGHLSEGSFDELSISAVARDAGVTRALVHHYFGGKQALHDAVLEREFARLLSATGPDPALGPEQNLDRALNAYFSYFASSSGELRALYAAPRSAGTIGAESVSKNHAVLVERILGLLDAPGTALQQFAVASWLGFVEEAARTSVSTPGIARSRIISLCKDTLFAAIGSLESDGSDTPHHESESSPS